MQDAQHFKLMVPNRYVMLEVHYYTNIGNMQFSYCIAHPYLPQNATQSQLWQKKIKNENIENSIVYTDSLRVLRALHPRNPYIPMIGDILHSITFIKQGRNMGFAGYQATSESVETRRQVNVQEKHDVKKIRKVSFPYKDVMKSVHYKLINAWQARWHPETKNKLHLIETHLRRMEVLEVHRSSFMSVTHWTHTPHTQLLTNKRRQTSVSKMRR